MANDAGNEVVLLMRLKPSLVKFPNAQEEIAHLLASCHRLFGPINPEAEYVAITGTDNGDLWLWIIEIVPPDKEKGSEEPLTEDDLEELLKEGGGGS